MGNQIPESLRRWRVHALEAEDAQDRVPQLARRLRVPPLVAQILWQRGLREAPAAERFLQPKLAHLQPPKGLPDIDKAAKRITDAVVAGQAIAVCGDYDVDGMTGTSLLVRFLQLVHAEVHWFIPDRELDGYGLSVRLVERVAASGAKVAITVDNGVSAHPAIEAAVEAGIDVVVTDHHLPGDTLPPAYAIVNPHLEGHDLGDNRTLCGCALAFKLAWAVADRLRGRMGAEGQAAFKLFLRDAMGLVALATLADQMPLVGENRVLVSAGLTALRASEHPGIQALLQVAKLGRQPLTTEDVAFKIAPRLNAAGRLSQPELVIELLTCDDPATAKDLAKRLDQANIERRRIQEVVLEQAEAQAAELVKRDDPAGLVVAGQGWHIGVVGIVAARLVDMYTRPTIVVGLDGDSGRGSCRTPDGVDLHVALTACADTLVKYGGHAMAAGLEVEATNMEALRAAFDAAVAEQLANPDAAPALPIDAESEPDAWSLESVQSLRRLAPFGKANPEPSFLLRGVEVAGTPRLMGNPALHLAFNVKQQDGAIRVIAWRRHDLFDLVNSGTRLDLVAVPVLNEWRGVASAELRLVDLRAHDEADAAQAKP